VHMVSLTTQVTSNGRKRMRMQQRWFASIIFLSCLTLATLLNLQLQSQLLDDDSPAATTEITSLNISRTNEKSNSIDDHNHNPVIPTVACFFMVNQQSTEMAVSVRYSHWGKRCTHFVIVTNGGIVDGEQYIDKNTILVDVHRVIQLELEAWGATTNFFYGNHSGVLSNTTTIPKIPSYATFPPPDDEIKQNLGLKAFYSWMYMTRNYASRVDYIMKVDPDTYMLMDNYLRYLAEYYKPTQHAYIGRVFKGEHLAFVTGLSITLSRTTAQYLLSKSAIHKRNKKSDEHDNNSGGYDHHNYPDECTAEQFEGNGAVEDYSLSACLSSVGVFPSYTRDGLGRERFLHFDPSYHVLGSDEQQAPEWYRRFSFTPLRPRNMCCSDEACAFHYVYGGRQNDTLVWDTFFGWWHWKQL